MDETSLSQDELYTFITNKSAHGRKGSPVAMGAVRRARMYSLP